MSKYRERLYPGPWVFIMTALIIPASLLVFLPINPNIGVVCAIVLYGTCVVLLLASSPRIEITETTLIAGRAHLPLTNVGEATGYLGRDATAERGTRLDARAWLVIRGWIAPVVKVVVDDPTDPAPYWLLSTRKPAALVRALEEARSETRA